MIKVDWLRILKAIYSNHQAKFHDNQLVMKQFLVFCLIGILNTVTDWSIYYFLTRGCDVYYLVANIFSFIVAASLGYVLNSRLTFKQIVFSERHFFKYIIVSVFTLALVQIGLYSAVEYLQIWDLLAKVLLLVVSVLSNFFWNKYWTFAD